jgi:hypothetical protein
MAMGAAFKRLIAILAGTGRVAINPEVELISI